jgi:hypothetical protein
MALFMTGASASRECNSCEGTDTFVKMDARWLFVERQRYVDWLEQRELP